MTDLAEEKERRGGSIIRALHLMNFKGIGELTDIPIKPVTLLFGSNSAGKSTVLHALLYAREILTRRNLDPDRTELGGERVDLGGFENFVHGHNTADNLIELGFTLELRDQDLGEDVLSEGERYLIANAEECGGLPEDWLSTIDEIRICLQIEWSKTRERPVVRNVDVEADGEKIVGIHTPPGSRDVRIDFLNLHHGLLIADDDDDRDSPYSFMGELLFEAFDDVGNRVQADPEGSDFEGVLTSIPLLGLDDAMPDLEKLLEPRTSAGPYHGVMQYNPLAYSMLVQGFLTGLIVSPLKVIRDELNRLTYLGPLRDMPAREFVVPKSPDLSRWVGGLAAWDELAAANPELLKQVNDWLFSERRLNSNYAVIARRYKKLEVDGLIWMGLDRGEIDEVVTEEFDQLELEPTFTKISLMDTSSYTEVLPHDVGVGISQLLPVIIASLVNRYGLVAVEQPELHIHPAWQVVLGDLFLQQSKENSSTFLIETHSEHLLLRLLKRIRQTSRNRLPEGETPAYIEDVGVLFVGNDGSGLDIRELRIDENGRMLDEWPRGFFEETYNETFRD